MILFVALVIYQPLHTPPLPGLFATRRENPSVQHVNAPWPLSSPPRPNETDIIDDERATGGSAREPHRKRLRIGVPALDKSIRASLVAERENLPVRSIVHQPLAIAKADSQRALCPRVTAVDNGCGIVGEGVGDVLAEAGDGLGDVCGSGPAIAFVVDLERTRTGRVVVSDE